MRPTKANSGSSLGSTPNSNPEPPRPAAPVPSSPWIIGDEIKASDRWGPGGTVTKWLLVPSYIQKIDKLVNNKFSVSSKEFKLKLKLLL